MGLRDDVAKVLIPEESLRARVAELGQAINGTYTDTDRPLLVAVLKGAFVFLADLTRHLEMRHEVDFMEVSSYAHAGLYHAQPADAETGQSARMLALEQAIAA